MTIDDLERLSDPDKLIKHRLDNLAKACADATSDDMKSMWYNKMIYNNSYDDSRRLK